MSEARYLLDILMDEKLVLSRSEARRLLALKAIKVNDREADMKALFTVGSDLTIQMGKRDPKLVTVKEKALE